MDHADVVGYINDGLVSCAKCAEGDDALTDEDNEEVTPIFAGSEGWEEMTCDGCNETLGSVEGVE